ncbi:MAG: hypothetical protein ICV73_06620 [Acetobacteraceae bacterium]|nr:hypothetical protein [Acetobacteraceae bacterium]
MPEDQARTALRTFVAAGGLEAWVADLRWGPVPGGWTVPGGSLPLVWPRRIAPLAIAGALRDAVWPPSPAGPSGGAAGCMAWRADAVVRPARRAA